MMIDLHPDTVATILAALHFYHKHEQGVPANRDERTHEIAMGCSIGHEVMSSYDQDLLQTTIRAIEAVARSQLSR